MYKHGKELPIFTTRTYQHSEHTTRHTVNNLIEGHQKRKTVARLLLEADT